MPAQGAVGVGVGAGVGAGDGTGQTSAIKALLWSTKAAEIKNPKRLGHMVN